MAVTKLNFQGTTRTSRLIFKDWEKGLQKEILNSKKKGHHIVENQSNQSNLIFITLQYIYPYI